MKESIQIMVSIFLSCLYAFCREANSTQLSSALSLSTSLTLSQVNSVLMHISLPKTYNDSQVKVRNVVVVCGLAMMQKQPVKKSTRIFFIYSRCRLPTRQVYKLHTHYSWMNSIFVYGKYVV